jgi:hypothetical protein
LRRSSAVKNASLAGLFTWPGGQKPFLFAPRVLAVAERSDIPVVLACGGVPPTRTFLFGPAWVTARPELKARIAAAATEMLSMRIIFSPMLGRTAYRLRPKLAAQAFRSITAEREQAAWRVGPLGTAEVAFWVIHVDFAMSVRFGSLAEAASSLRLGPLRPSERTSRVGLGMSAKCQERL